MRKKTTTTSETNYFTLKCYVSLELLLAKNFYRSELSYIKSNTFSTSSTSYLTIYVRVGRQKDPSYKEREYRKKMSEDNVSSGSDGIPREIRVKKKRDRKRNVQNKRNFRRKVRENPVYNGDKRNFRNQVLWYMYRPASCNTTIVYRQPTM